MIIKLSIFEIRPIIAQDFKCTTIRAALDVLEDRKNGVTVGVNDASEPANVISRLLDRPENRMGLGKSAREAITNRFAPEKELEANLNVYRESGISL
jgi:glycosyltransferase involved in cell wall biosynthesis